MNIPIMNTSAELSEYKDAWTFDEKYSVWCLEDVLYTQKATTPAFQRLSIFVPQAYLNADGTVNEDGTCGRYSAKTAPVVFENNSAGYMQMPHTWLGGPRDMAPQYLARGMVYVTAGSRGRESKGPDGKRNGKSPWTLVDLKTAIRFIRHNAAVLPGNFDHIISVGWSAGGAMSTLIGVTGDNENYLPYLEENGAFLDESDAVYASQIYCPIIDLDHADAAYEWQFRADKENEDSPAGPAAVMTPYQEALSAELSARYIEYFNGLGLKDPVTGEAFVLGEDGRSGNAYDYLMGCLNDSATKYLAYLSAGKLDVDYSAADYIAGNYMVEKDAPLPDGGPDGPDGPGPGGPGGPGGSKDEAKKDAALLAGHAGPGVALNLSADLPMDEPPSLGMMMLRPPKGQEGEPFAPPTIQVPGDEKSIWLTWDGEKAAISDLDTYVLNHRRRMKPCTSFDTLGADSGENQEFGTPEKDYVHFSALSAAAVDSLKGQFPEADGYSEAWKEAVGDEALDRRIYLINPLNYIGTDEVCAPTQYFRIRVGAQDADTAFIVSMLLSVKLKNAGKDADYALVWDRPHCEADYPGEVCDWIEEITAES